MGNRYKKVVKYIIRWYNKIKAEILKLKYKNTWN